MRNEKSHTHCLLFNNKKVQNIFKNIKLDKNKDDTDDDERW